MEQNILQPGWNIFRYNLQPFVFPIIGFMQGILKILRFSGYRKKRCPGRLFFPENNTIRRVFPLTGIVLSKPDR